MYKDVIIRVVIICRLMINETNLAFYDLNNVFIILVIL